MLMPICSNYNSVLQNESTEFVHNLIISELLDDKFVVADHQPLCVHALGAIRKKNGGNRLITDCRRPLNISINNFQSFEYKSSDDVCNLMYQSCYMATVDILSAYHSVAISPLDWDYQGISWKVKGQQTFLFDTRLSFGLRCAPYIFTEIGEFVVRCMARKGYIYSGKLYQRFLGPR